MKKRLISSILTLALLLTLFSGLGGAAYAASGDYAIWPEMTGVISTRYSMNGAQVSRVEVGDVFQLEFWLNGIDPYAITIPVNWDPSVVTMVNDQTGEPATDGLKSAKDLGDGFRPGEACYDFSYGWNYLPKYWNGVPVFSAPQEGHDGYPYIDNLHGHCRIFFYVDAATPSAGPQLFLSLTFRVLKEGEPNFHFATDRERYYDIASPDGMTLAFTEDGVIVSDLVIPEVYVISDISDQTPAPTDPGLGTPDDINYPVEKDEPSPAPPPGPTTFYPIPEQQPTVDLKTAAHLDSYPYSMPVYTKAVIRSEGGVLRYSDDYILPESTLAAAINSLVASQASAIVVKMPDRIIDKEDYTLTFSCANLDDLNYRVRAMLYFETPYGYIGVDPLGLMAELNDKAQVTVSLAPVSGGVRLMVKADGRTISGFSSPVFLLILPYDGEGTPRVTSSSVFGQDITTDGQPMSIDHYYEDLKVISFLTASAGTYCLEERTRRTYTDVAETYWGFPAITNLSSTGILRGKTDTRFDPEGKVTRAEMAKMITCTLSAYQEEYNMSFTDVDVTDWFYPYVGSAHRVGVVNGRSEKTFAPQESISRQDMAVMAYRGLTLLGVVLTPEREEPEFTDKTEISSYAEEAVTALYRAGILNGMKDGSFQPFGTATRAQAAQIINGVYLKIQNLV